MSEVVFRPATELAAAIRARALSPVALVEAYLERIARLDGTLHAYITVCGDAALAEAKAAERALARGDAVGPLHGVPFAVKDQFDTAGVRTTAGSRLRADHVPARDATVVARLRAAGAILLGKLNLTEFAFGGTQEFPFGQPRNPWNPAHDPDGSSSGSGIAAAAALAAFTLGEDTGGSIRTPAAWCGVVGHRPTWGLVPRTGCFPLAVSMDAPGPIGRTVGDVAAALAVIAGHDPADPLSRRAPAPDVTGALEAGAGGLRISVVRELTNGEDTDPEIAAAVRDACRTLGARGARVEDVSLPLLPVAGAVFMALADSEGAALHARALRERAHDFDRATRRRLLAASLLPATLLQQAARARALLREQILRTLERVDLLACPVSPRPTPRIAEVHAPVASTADAAARFFTRRSYTTPWSLAGLPAIAVPCGLTTAGLPIALQLVGRPLEDATVLRAARAHETARPGPAPRPALGA